MPDVRFGVLGPVTAWRGADVAEVGSGKALRVLGTLLLSANQRVERDRIIEDVWCGAAPRSAVNLVQKYVGDLRRSLGLDGGSLRTLGTAYLLCVPPGRLDSARFAAGLARGRAAAADGDLGTARQCLTDALGLWRGPAFGGLNTPAAAAERERLAEYRSGALEDLAELDVRRGEHALAIPELTRLAAEHPYRERLRELLMLALYRAGRQADALAVFDGIRRRLAGDLGADPGPGLRRVHAGILRADPALDPPAASPAPARPIADPGTPVVPRQLPATPASFVGRRRELAWLDAGPSVCAIVGPAGIGKTSLALRWAARHPGRFPDGQLFADLRGRAPAGTDPAEVVGGFLEALGVLRVPAAPHRRTALFRSLVAGKRLLLVLDDAAGTGQVLPLLPGGGTCTVLVTSRTRLPGLVARQAARHLALDALSGTEARALLTARLGAARVAAEAPAADRLIDLCGGVPLALSRVAAEASTRPGTTLTALAAEPLMHPAQARS
ncbi:BTAD domain-containing putative transcriptional regulator [Amycolatopsis sp. NPDC051102]|uniref:AfsR/SARP family transcriptional regulator n=1 Tax=Amycolatopsis sp. NPDC051102 TaxID=3155163 RepID=UPI00342F2E7D